MGLFPGILVILFSAAASASGLYFLSRCAARTDGRFASFFAISKLTWPNLAVFFDAAIAIKCFGVAVSYLIIIGDLMPQVKTMTRRRRPYMKAYWLDVYIGGRLFCKPCRR